MSVPSLIQASPNLARFEVGHAERIARKTGSDAGSKPRKPKTHLLEENTGNHHLTG